MAANSLPGLVIPLDGNIIDISPVNEVVLIYNSLQNKIYLECYLLKKFEIKFIQWDGNLSLLSIVSGF